MEKNYNYPRLMDKRERLSILRRAEDFLTKMGEGGLPDPHPLGNLGLAEDMIATAVNLGLKRQKSPSKTDPQSS